MSKQIMPSKESNAYHHLQTVCDGAYHRSAIAAEELKDYQRLQMRHDEIYHFDIIALGVHRRMSHVTLHLIKYLYVLSSLPASAPENKKAFIDSFIMVVSASNLLGISLAKSLVVEQATSSDGGFINEYIQLLAKLAKACEATDHQEDYPIRATWNKNIQRFFSLLVHEATSRNISLLEEATHRLASVERKHPLDEILQEQE